MEGNRRMKEEQTSSYGLSQSKQILNPIKMKKMRVGLALPYVARRG